MKGFLLAIGLCSFVLLAVGCATPTPTPIPIVPTAIPTFVIPATVTPQPLVPTSPPPTTVPPTNVPPTQAPQVSLGETKIYRDEVAGFEFDYPATWNTTPVSDAVKKDSVIYSATFYSWKPTSVSAEGIPEGGTKIDVGVYNNKASSPEAALEMHKTDIQNSDLGQTITAQEDWTLPSGLKATRLTVTDRFGESAEVITALNGRMILFGGVGDYELFDAIAHTLRPI